MHGAMLDLKDVSILFLKMCISQQKRDGCGIDEEGAALFGMRKRQQDYVWGRGNRFH